MRQVTKQIRDAYLERRTLRVGNTYTDGNAVWLHGNKIVERRNGETWITNAGWFSGTTKERLNAFFGVYIIQRQGVWFLNGAEWDGSWCNVTNNVLDEEAFDGELLRQILIEVEREAQERIARRNEFANGVDFELSDTFDQNFNQVNNIAEDVEIDVTSEWSKEGYIKPIHSVYHTNDKTTISEVVRKLKLAGINYKEVETDTAGTYKPNYFVVVNPNDIQLALQTL